jgi:nitroreductase
MISRMAEMVRTKSKELSQRAGEIGEPGLRKFFHFMRQYGGFFGGAAAVVVACGEPYDVSRFGLDGDTLAASMSQLGVSGITDILRRTVEKSVALAVQNLLLKAHELGYGSCAMDAPLMIEAELRELLDIPQWQQLVMVVPLGVPARVPPAPARRPVEDVIRYV